MTRRGAKFMVHVLGTLVGVASVLLAGAAWRLAQGPVTLDSMTPYIEAALNAEETGYRFEIGSAQLAWGDWQRAFDLRILDVMVLHDDGSPAFGAGEVLLEMALPPLMRGELRPRAITVIGPSVDVLRDRDGSVTLALLNRPVQGVPAEETPAPAAETGDDLLSAFLAVRDQAPFERLERVSLLGARLHVDDRLLGVKWDAPAAELVLRRRGEGLDLSTRATLRSGTHKLDLDMVAVYEPVAGTVLMSAHLIDFALADLSFLMPVMPPLDGLDLSVDGELTLALDTDLHVRSGSFAVAAQGGQIDLPEVFEAPITLGPTRASGHIRPGFSGIEIAELELGLPAGTANGQVVIGGYGPGDVIEARLDIAALPVDDVSAYWPVPLVTRAREWIVDHISDGIITQGSLAFSATVADLAESALPLANLTIDLDVTGGSIIYLNGMPPVTGIDAAVRIVDDTMRIDATTGMLNGLVGQRGVITMDTLSGDKGMLIGAEASGDLQRALELLTNPNLDFSSVIELDPTAVQGEIDGRLEIVLPFLLGLSRNDVQFRVAAELGDLQLVSGLRGYRVDGGQGTLLFDSTTAVFDGALRLNDVPFEVAYRQSFRQEEAVRRTVEMRATLEDGQREALGIPDFIAMTGPVGIVLDLAQTDAGSMIWSAVADLTATAIDYPLLAIDKAVGTPGRAALRLVDDLGPVLHLESISIAVGTTELTASGALRAADLAPIRLDLQQLAFGRNAVAGALSVREDGVFDVTLSGGTADLEPMLEDMTASTGPTLPAFHIEGALDTVWLTDNDTVSDVRIDGTYSGDHWEALAVTGLLGEGEPTSLNIWRFSPQERRFEYSAGSAGGAIRAVGLFDHAEGGTLDIRARIDDSNDERRASGAMRATDFTLTQAPILAQLLSVASMGGLANALTGDGLEFENALIPFEKVGDKVTISDGRAYGPGLGITIFGTVNLESNALDLQGTIVPIYSLNAALGEIPLIGDILTGFEEGGGLFGFTYEVTGPREDPQVSVDPLSLLTPGILRRLFSAPTDDEVKDLTFESSRQEGGR